MKNLPLHKREKTNSIFKFARRCDITGEGMNEGWVIGDGEFYIKDETNAENWCKEAGYASIEDALDEDAIYWTEWDELDEDMTYESPYEDGREAVLVSAE
jgi:hypothetical protein